MKSKNSKNNSDGKTIHGTDRMVSNVFSSWAMQLVFIVAGFILPRLINDELGQVQLGIWDLCWSIVAYFKLVKVGIVSSINPFVAKFRAVGDDANINVSASSVTAVLLVMSISVIVLTLITASLLPYFYSAQLNQYCDEGQIIIMFLGTSLAAEISQSVFGGVLTGCHRWDILNGINAGVRLFTMASMIICLILKGGLIQLAGIEMTGEIIGFIVKMIAAKKVYRPLKIRISMIRIQRIKEMMKFGLKTFVPGIGQLISNQTIRLMLVWHMGPALLAVFVRPASLMAHMTTFITRYAFVFTPTTSSIISQGDREGLQKLAIQASRYGAFLTLPLVSTVAIFGGPIIYVWMGAGYENQLLITTMSVGSLPILLQLPANSILRGMNAHGRPGIARLLASLFSVLLVGLCLTYVTKDVSAVALSAVFPLALVETFYVTRIYIKKLEVSLSRYLKESFLLPISCCIPQVVIMLNIRLLFPDRIFPSIGLALFLSSIVTGFLYYRYALPERYKSKLSRKISQIPFIGKKIVI